MSQSRRMAKTAGTISGLTMISRVFGYVRDGIGGALFGAGTANDAFLAAFRIPNLLRDLFAEGALSSAFIPTFTRTRIQEGPARAWRLAAVILNALAVVMLALVLAGELGAPGVVRMIVPGFARDPDKLALTVELTRILFPFLGFVSFAAVLMGILNSHERFGWPAFAPVVFNLTMIGFGIAALHGMGASPEEKVKWWAWGALAGGAMQLLVQVPAILRLGFRWRPILDWRDPGLRRMLVLMGPAVIGLSVTQINLFVNTLIASFLPEGSVTYLYYGNRLMQLPLGVFGVAIATALLPVTSGHLARGDRRAFLDALSYGLRLLVIITVPAAVGLIVLAEPINRLLFEYGRFSPEAVRAVARASVCYSLGLVAYAGVKVVVPTFYALSEARTPVIAAVLAVVVNVILNLLLMQPLGYLGLALATAVSAGVNFVYLLVRLRRRVGGLDGKRILATSVRVCLAAAAMSLLVWQGSRGWLPDAGAGAARAELALKVFALIGFGAFGYAAFAWFFRVPEQRRLWDLIRAKVGLGGAGESWVE